jgi:AraC family transcriptional regulator
MTARIETLAEKKLVGKRIRMTLSDNKTTMLWQSFMPRRKEIKNTTSNELFSMQVYGEAPEYPDPNREFEKWAAIEVTDFNDVPDGMETYVLKGGLYAVFIHKGGPETFERTFNFIYNVWMPASDFQLDSREHFEILGEKYKHGSLDAEEEVWIPIKIKNS